MRKQSVILSVFDTAKSSVFVQTDTCQTCVRFEMCDNPSVLAVGKAICIHIDGHVSYMRALRDVQQSVGDSVSIGRQKSRR